VASIGKIKEHLLAWAGGWRLIYCDEKNRTGSRSAKWSFEYFEYTANSSFRRALKKFVQRMGLA